MHFCKHVTQTVQMFCLWQTTHSTSIIFQQEMSHLEASYSICRRFTSCRLVCSFLVHSGKCSNFTCSNQTCFTPLPLAKHDTKLSFQSWLTLAPGNRFPQPYCLKVSYITNKKLFPCITSASTQKIQSPPRCRNIKPVYSAATQRTPLFDQQLLSKPKNLLLVFVMVIVCYP